MHYIHWSLRREGFFPILLVRGESAEKENEFFMMKFAIKIFETAEKFGGVPRTLTSEEIIQSAYPISINFSIIFASHRDLEEFVGTITNGLGL